MVLHKINYIMMYNVPTYFVTGEDHFFLLLFLFPDKSYSVLSSISTVIWSGSDHVRIHLACNYHPVSRLFVPYATRRHIMLVLNNCEAYLININLSEPYWEEGFFSRTYRIAGAWKTSNVTGPLDEGFSVVCLIG